MATQSEYLMAVTERLYLLGVDRGSYHGDRGNYHDIIAELNQLPVRCLLDLTSHSHFSPKLAVNAAQDLIIIPQAVIEPRLADAEVIAIVTKLVEFIDQDHIVAIALDALETKQGILPTYNATKRVAWLLAVATVALQCNLRLSQVETLAPESYRDFNRAQLDRLLQPVDFYSSKGPYGAFSNFSAHPVSSSDLGYVFPNGEALFQAYKSERAQEREEFIACNNPRQAKDKGRLVKLRPDWEQVKYRCMLVVIEDKVNTNPELKTLLLSTGIRPIYEHTERDRIWGDGGESRNGMNLLGKAWSWLRQKLRRVLVDATELTEMRQEAEPVEALETVEST